MSVVKCEMRKYIRENFDEKTVTQIAIDLGVSRSKVTRLSKKMGLEKEKTYKNKGEKFKMLPPPLDRYFVTETGVLVNHETNKELKWKISDTGYPLYTMQVDHVKHERYVHRLLAEAFIENPESKPHVNHIDGNKANFELSNLEWCTPKENAEHASKNNLLKVGEEHPFAKITEKEALEVKRLLSLGYSVREINNKMKNTTKSIVEKIRSGCSWKHI